MNILEHVKKLLVDAGISTTIKLASLPNTPAEIIVLYQTGGIEPDPNMTAKTIHEPTVQAFVRSNEYANGADILEEVRDALHQLREQNVTVDGKTIRFIKILALAEGGHIGSDGAGSDLDEFTINFGVKCHATT